ncbi:MAG: DEAD/DEAH box helicase family protein [Candidatus Hodarchaeales archaeon]
MGLKDINLKSVYFSDEDDLLRDFYIPVLSNSVKYDRIAGYFSSNSLAIAAKGIAAFINNGGRIRLITNVVLSEEDQKSIIKALRDQEQCVLSEIENLEDKLKRDHISMLGWMVKNGLLEIKIAVIRNGIEHQKTGILIDSSGNTLSFSGSDNETVKGWIYNDEQFHVFCSWKEGDRDHLLPDIERFSTLWKDKGRNVRVYDVSNAFRKGLICIAPHNDEEFKKLSHKATEELLLKHSRRLQKEVKTKKIRLRDYQEEAIKKWLNNNRRGILEMATGTGKTFTALGCLAAIHSDSTQLVVIISLPYGHLIGQWKNEIDKFGLSFDRLIVADSSNPKWKDQLYDSLTDVALGHLSSLIVYTTHNTFSSKTFASILNDHKGKVQIALLADEVHGVGATKTMEGLLECYDFRIGLSATPKRWFDDVGTDVLYDFFEGVVFEFTLKDAINKTNPDTNQTYLTPYKYCPVFIPLSDDELQEYVELSKSVASKFSSSHKHDTTDELIKILIFKRADIVKNAISKYKALDQLLSSIENSLSGTIVYCSPQQINRVMEILNARGIICHRFTMTQDAKASNKYDGRSERDIILERFAKGEYQVLVAMRCLDEGVDIPSAQRAIIMASSGNPREYIQRIGRVIRHYPGKNMATIHDFIVTPSLAKLPADFKKIENIIFEKELKRYEEIARIAINGVTAIRELYEIRRITIKESL